jgi:hypothetical protein
LDTPKIMYKLLILSGDGSKEWTPEWMQKLDHRFGDDGVFWMSYDDLMKKYQLFDRTRLFSNEWKITQQWTTVTVPWNVDYNDTKFTFTLEKKSSVVIVLSQVRYLQSNHNYFLANLCLSLILDISVVLRVNTTSAYHSVSINQARRLISYAATISTT